MFKVLHGCAEGKRARDQASVLRVRGLTEQVSYLKSWRQKDNCHI